MTDFVVGELYTRDQIAERIAMPIERRGGAWDTGYDEWQGEAFLFTNVGVAGRTGHDYGNRFEGKDLIWFGKTRAKRGQPQIDRLISNEVPVHVFWRGQDRSPFTYAGVGEAVEATGDVPVKVVWTFERGTPTEVRATTSLLDPEPIWRRGPPPFTGPAIANRQDGETVVYLMRLEGAVRAVVEILDGHCVVKIGMSNKGRTEVDRAEPRLSPELESTLGTGTNTHVRIWTGSIFI